MKDIIGYENLYAITENGNVWSYKRNAFLKLQLDKNGYKVCDLRHNGNRKNFKVHRLVASTFIDNPNNKLQVNHKDGNKQNNSVENLEWVTPKENTRHALNTKLITSDIFGKLTFKDVRVIKCLIKFTSYSQREIAKMFNVSVSTICMINTNKIWLNAKYAEDK